MISLVPVQCHTDNTPRSTRRRTSVVNNIDAGSEDDNDTEDDCYYPPGTTTESKYLMEKIDLIALCLARDTTRSDEESARLLTVALHNFGMKVVVTSKKIRLARDRLRKQSFEELIGYILTSKYSKFCTYSKISITISTSGLHNNESVNITFSAINTIIMQATKLKIIKKLEV